MTDGTTIAVQGLRELNGALRRIDREAPKGLRVALNGVAKLVADDIRPTIPRKTGKARASLKVASTRTAARIRVGGAKAPYFPWLDYGGKTGVRKSVKRPFIKSGRYVYPGLSRNKAAAAAALKDALDAVVRDAGLDVT